MKKILFLIATATLTLSMFTVCNENDMELAANISDPQIEAMMTKEDDEISINCGQEMKEYMQVSNCGVSEKDG